jgi:hypothetical protein
LQPQGKLNDNDKWDKWLMFRNLSVKINQKGCKPHGSEMLTNTSANDNTMCKGKIKICSATGKLKFAY